MAGHEPSVDPRATPPNELVDSPIPDPDRSRRRRLVRVGAVIALVVLVVAVLTERWFVHPQMDDPGTADAIFVLGGGGDRVEFALDLARRGVAPEVVFASGYVNALMLWAVRPCNDRAVANLADDVSLRCIEPVPGTTRGEARLLRDLADSSGWETVVVVASVDQITRARRLIERCWGGDVRLTGPPHDQAWPLRAVYEWGAGVKATFLRGC